MPVVRDLDGDVFCGRLPARHAVVLQREGDLFKTACSHGSTAVVVDGCVPGDGAALVRLAANAVLAVVTCDCAEPELACILSECTRYDVRVVQWDVSNWRNGV